MTSNLAQPVEVPFFSVEKGCDLSPKTSPAIIQSCHMTQDMAFSIPHYFCDLRLLTVIVLLTLLEDVDPSVGRFRNMVTTAVVPLKVTSQISSALCKKERVIYMFTCF